MAEEPPCPEHPKKIQVFIDFERKRPKSPQPR